MVSCYNCRLARNSLDSIISMRTRLLLHILLTTIVIACYCGSFIALPALHSHHQTLFCKIAVKSAQSSKFGGDHPTNCVVCSRINTTYPLVFQPVPVSAELCSKPTEYSDPIFSSGSGFSFPSKGRAPPVNSL